MDNFAHEFEQAMRGLDYPATRDKLLSLALENNAAPEVVDLIRAQPETADFLNEEAVERTFGVRVPGARYHSWE